MPLSPGQILNHRYRIDKLLGQGGYGAVYHAWDIHLETPRAIKENLDNSADAQRQFKQEAQILDKLVHPNLPRVIDHFIIPGQGQYLVMDFVEGQDLEAMLEEGGALPESQLLPWIAQVCDALSYLHTQNPAVIHRDIKPGNIKITPEGKAVLVDFGIAKVYDPKMRTAMGARAVTSGYSPPEQYGRGVTDAQSDVYALGATLYHLLTGVPPPDSVDRLSGSVPLLTPPRALNPAVSSGVSDAIVKAMRLERGERWSSVQAFKDALSLPQASGQKPPVDLGKVPTVPRPAALAATVPPSKPLPSAARPPSAAPSSAMPVPKPASAKPSPKPVPVPPSSTPSTARRKPWIWFGVFLVSLIGLIWLGTSLLPHSALISAPLNPIVTSAHINLGGLSSLPQFITDEHGVKMALVPAGKFQMGSENGDSDEKPVHTVTLDAFYMDVYEVTNKLYARCVQANACTKPAKTSSERHNSYFRDPAYLEYPVVYVTWKMAKTYCEWRGADLPAEAQWEKAARAGLKGMNYPWGNETPVCRPGSTSSANFAGCFGDTVAVGSYSPNSYGLYDMAGNVWEWVEDGYAAYTASSGGSPVEPPSAQLRVTRGGSWANQPDNLRVADRFYRDPAFAYSNLGFRCARQP